jgi:hypothetical protein
MPGDFGAKRAIACVSFPIKRFAVPDAPGAR